MGLTEKTVTGVMWTVLGEIIVKLISPLAFLVLTRILSPEDFGVVAIATTILMLIQIITDLGTSKVLVQLKCSEKEFGKYCDSAFYFNVILGVLLFAIVFIFSQQIANYNNQPQAAIVIRVMSVQILIYSFSTVQNAIKNRNLDFKSLFYIRLITVAAPALISIPIALLGGGLWAIVGGSVSGAFFNMIALWLFSDWRPSLSFNKSYLNNILGNSLWSSSQQFIQWIPISLDTFLISNYLTASDLGIYSATRSLFTSVSAIILGPIIPVLFSSLSKVDDSQKFIKISLFAQKTMFLISVIVAVVFFAYRDIISTIIFNNKWIGISSVLGVVFLLMGFEYFYSIIIECLRSKGMFKEIAVNNLICVLIAIPLLFYSSNISLMTYVIARCSALYFLYFGIFYCSEKYLNISFMQCLKNCKWIFVFSVPLIVASMVMYRMMIPPLTYYITVSFLFVLSAACLMYNERKFLGELIKLLKSIKG